MQRMGFDHGVLMGREKSRAFNCWAYHTRATKEVQRRAKTRAEEMRIANENDGDTQGKKKQGEGALTTCNNHINLLIFRIKSMLHKFVLSNALEHAVIQAVIVSTIIQVASEDYSTTRIQTRTALRALTCSLARSLSLARAHTHPRR